MSLVIIDFSVAVLPEPAAPVTIVCLGTSSSALHTTLFSLTLAGSFSSLSGSSSIPSGTRSLRPYGFSLSSRISFSSRLALQASNGDKRNRKWYIHLGERPSFTTSHGDCCIFRSCTIESSSPSHGPTTKAALDMNA